MNRRILLWLHYVSLMTGIVVINYILNSHKEYADEIIQSIQNMNRLYSANGQELFFYLFTKRLKQSFILLFLYFQISKPFTIFFLIAYSAFFEGIYISMYFYYFNLEIAFLMFVIILPQFVCYITLRMAGKIYTGIKSVHKNVGLANACLFTLIVIIVMTIIEMAVNLKLIPFVFSYK